MRRKGNKNFYCGLPVTSQGTVAAEDSCLKIVHQKIGMQRSEFLSPRSKSAKKELRKKMTVSRTFPWNTGSFLLLLAIVALLSYDIKKHGSFHSSSTGQFLNDIGALQCGEHAWARTKFYSNKSYQWAQANFPHYYKLAGEHTKPYLELAWDVYVVAVHQLHKMYENIYAYVEEKMPAVIEWINSYAPRLLDKVKAYSTEGWEQMKQNALILWQFFLRYSYAGLEWFKDNVFVGTLSPENLQKYSLEALNTTQVYAVWTYDCVCQKVQTLSKIQWSEANVPHYYKLAGEHTKPYLELAWDVYVVAVHQLHKMYENIYAYVEEKMPAVIEWINSYAPRLLDKVKVYSTEAWEQMKQNALIVWQFFLRYSYAGLEWFEDNVFVGTLSPENLQKYSLEALNTTQVYAVWTYDWVCQKVQTLSKIQ